MKKQIAFYVGWVLTFFLYLRLFDASDIWMLNYIRKTYRGSPGDFFPSILMDIGLLLVLGMILSLLIYVSFQFKFTRRLAFIELLIIGIPSFCLATLILTSYMAYINVLEFFKINHWLYYGTSTHTYATIGFILLGYEFMIFIIRMLTCKKTGVSSELE